MRDRPKISDERNGLICCDLPPLRSGLEHPPRLRARTALVAVDKAALHPLGEHVVDRREADIRPLSHTALLYNLFKVVAVPWLLNAQAQQGNLVRSQSHLSINRKSTS